MMITPVDQWSYQWFDHILGDMLTMVRAIWNTLQDNGHSLYNDQDHNDHFFISMLDDRHKKGFCFSHNALPLFFQKESSLRPSGSPLESWGGDLVRKNIDGVVHDVEGGVLHVVVIHITAWWMCQKAVSRSRLDLKIIKLSINYIKRGCRGREIDPDCFSYLGNNARLIMQQRSRNDNQGISFSREIKQKNKDFLELFALILAEAAHCSTFMCLGHMNDISLYILFRCASIS